MRCTRLGKSDLDVSEICLGTMTWGQQNSEAEAHAQLDYAMSRGINFIDAAEMYPVPPRAETQGSTERILGSWLRGRPRDKVIVATKITGPGGVLVISPEGKRLDRPVGSGPLRISAAPLSCRARAWPTKVVRTPPFAPARRQPLP